MHAKAELYSSSTFDGTPTCDRRSDTDGLLRVIPRGKNTTQHSTMSLADSGGVRIGTGNLFVGP